MAYRCVGLGCNAASPFDDLPDGWSEFFDYYPSNAQPRAALLAIFDQFCEVVAPVVDWDRVETGFANPDLGAGLCPTCDAALKGALDAAGGALLLQGVRGHA
jgi:hypothetical protein